jgi:GntR family transcriptional regulator
VVPLSILTENNFKLSEAIDRSVPIPYYYQLREYLWRLIQSSMLKPGDQIPAEMEICASSGLSRTVVRQAIHELENEGYLVRFRGKGTFVARPKVPERLVQTLTGFYEDSVARGQIPETQVLDFELIPATAKIAQELQLPVGELVFHLNRLRSIDHEPILLVATYIPRYMAPDLISQDMTHQSLYRVLDEKYNLTCVRARRSLEAVPATSEEARMLQVEKGSPLLLLKSTGFLADSRPLEYFIARHRGDRSKFDVELVKPPSQ